MDAFSHGVRTLGAYPAKPVINELTRIAEIVRDGHASAVVDELCSAIDVVRRGARLSGIALWRPI